MKIISPLTSSLLLWLVAPAAAYYRGYNFKSYTADGSSCKTASDWKFAFNAVKQLPNSINAARLFYAAECDSLAHAVPEALNADVQILVGLDDSDSDFDAEKGALLAAIRKHGWSWILGVSVGSESLYRGDIGPASLSEKIYDVRGMLEALPGYPGDIEVGHVDTTNEWFDTANTAVLKACDFIGVDVYPYFQPEDNNHISNAGQLFNEAVTQARASVDAAGSLASVWVTETGWPVNGDQLGAAVPGVSNAASYFQQVACPSFEQLNTFWFTYQDWFAEPSFAVVNPQGEQYFSQECS
ncbi:glycoside hydrolase superfamily [Coniella lustricola]|uniref:Probable glucan endo-1,3-beta-glucosidase eglC n=1 Tax=Coniella lustricola TaxID=2025994 RepID=A0A2T3AE93_9PEZI|nr:glycoside hydrolase superfamily [Coniella lustricola]